MGLEPVILILKDVRSTLYYMPNTYSSNGDRVKEKERKRERKGERKKEKERGRERERKEREY